MQKPTTGIEIGENFGQIYNFTDNKKNFLSMSTDNIITFLNNGQYNGAFFIPINLKDSDDDNDALKAAKQAIKSKVKDAMDKDSDNPQAAGHDAFAKDIKKDVLDLMNNSDEYKASISGRNVNIDSQAGIVAEELAQFATNDMPGQIRSPGSLVQHQ